MNRYFRFLLLVGLSVLALPARAVSSPFDLVGPNLDVAVTHDGVTLPLDQVPNLAEGDRISVKLDLPPGSAERYRVVAAFLRGAVVRPPKTWFHQMESWRPKSAELSLTVPEGAQQVALFLSPERGTSADAIIATIRKQPGAFVRGVQELNQASLDRARLDAFLRVIQKVERESPASVASISPVLSHSLAIKLKSECLQQAVEVQAACLTVDRETLLLSDSHSSSLADTLTGAPTDLALQVSTTPQAGYGAYSSYIGVVRDVFRLFGAFQSAQLQFIPALSQLKDGRLTVLLNTPLSFAKPTSVMVVALPPVEAPKPPPMRNADADKTLCVAPGLVLPIDGAPLVYATQYARNMTLRLPLADGTQSSLAMRADPAAGGFVPDSVLPNDALKPNTSGYLHGDWGFASFDGPSFSLSQPDTGSWQAVEHTSLVVGRANDVGLVGTGVGCVSQVAMRIGDGLARPVAWKQSGRNGIVATLPLENAEPGPVSILVGVIGRTTPAVVTIRALREASGLDDLTFHAGDDEAVLSGTRLDQVQSVTVGGVVFELGAMTRTGKKDRLALRAVDSASTRALVEGKTITADVSFTGGRHKTVAVTVAAPREGVSLVRVSAQPPIRERLLPITLHAGDTFAQDDRLTFAFHEQGSTPLSGRETIEVGTLDGRAAAQIQVGKGYDLQDTSTGIVTFTPAEALGPIGYGPLRFRVVRDGDASSWATLATVVRLPEISALGCLNNRCTLTGTRLFLIKSLDMTQDFHDPQDIPDGFVASKIRTRQSRDGRIFLRLRDAPEVLANLTAR